MHAFLGKSIVVVNMVVSRLHARFEERAEKLALGRTGLDLHRPRAAAIGTGTLVKGLGSLKVRKAIRIGPSLEALARPIIIVPGIAADPIHPVYRRGAAEDSPTRLIDVAILDI